MSKNYLITGGAGFIGSNLAASLAKDGENVTVLDNFSTGSLKNLSDIRKDIDLIHSSCNEIEPSDTREIDTIFHLGMPSNSKMYREDPSLVGRVIDDFINLVRCARENDNDVIVASTSSLYGRSEPPHREDMRLRPFSLYPESRLKIERLGKVFSELYDLKITALRLFAVYGPRERAKGTYANMITQFIWWALEGKNPIVYGNGEQTRDFIHVDDVIRAFRLSSEIGDGFDVLNIGTGQETSFNKIIKKIGSMVSGSIEPRYISNPIENYVYRTLGDPLRAERELGFRSEINVQEGIKRQISNYSEEE